MVRIHTLYTSLANKIVQMTFKTFKYTIWRYKISTTNRCEHIYFSIQQPSSMDSSQTWTQYILSIHHRTLVSDTFGSSKSYHSAIGNQDYYIFLKLINIWTQRTCFYTFGVINFQALCHIYAMLISLHSQINIAYISTRFKYHMHCVCIQESNTIG